MAHTTQNWQAWDKLIDSFVKDEEEKIPRSQYRDVFSVTSTNRLKLDEITWSGFGPMMEVGELGDAVEDEAREGYQFTYVRRNYRKSARFSSNLMETQQIEVTEKIARDLVRSVEYSRNLYMFGMIRNAFNAAYTFGDSKPLVSTAHPRKDGGAAQANTYADGVQDAISYDRALELQDVLLANLSNSGNIMSLGAAGRKKVLWGGPYLREKLFQIAGVEGPEGEPDTTSYNNRNYFVKGDKFDVLVLDYVSHEAAVQAGETAVAKTSGSNYWDTMWGIMDIPKVQQNFKAYLAEGYAKYDEEVVKTNQVLKKYAYDAYAFGATNYLGFVASKGDGSTYTG